MGDGTSAVARAWAANCEVNERLLAEIPDAGLAARFAPRTRTVSAQFAHLHNVRVMHLSKREAEAGGLAPFPRGAEPARGEIEAALAASARAAGDLLSKGEATGRVPGWGGPPATFLAYLLAHEAHHRGQILVSLRLSGVKLPKEITYGLWDAWRRA
ncbi:MAG: DinB family protein [Planctomycetes bacterium]|jgi:uncharacterized damage-inducible protein DinB|nr:DinB family protein [Planctomycetota bacterium]